MLNLTEQKYLMNTFYAVNTELRVTQAFRLTTSIANGLVWLIPHEAFAISCTYVYCLNQGVVISSLDKDDWPLSTLRDSGDVGILCSFSNIPATAAAGNSRSSQLNSPLP